MISVSFKPDEAEIQEPTPDDAIPGQHRLRLRYVPGEPDQPH